jgi:hypothetical protein
MKRRSLILAAIVLAPLALAAPKAGAAEQGLWEVYNSVFKGAKYIDLTHAFNPTIPVWPGFGNARFKPAAAGRTIEGYVKEGQEFTYKEHGFIATAGALGRVRRHDQRPAAHLHAQAARRHRHPREGRRRSRLPLHDRRHQGLGGQARHGA